MPALNALETVAATVVSSCVKTAAQKTMPDVSFATSVCYVSPSNVRNAVSALIVRRNARHAMRVWSVEAMVAKTIAVCCVRTV